MTNFDIEIQKQSKNIEYSKEWYIFHTDSCKAYKHCICGHNVKRITYIYNKITKNIMFVGTTCVKKYGITQHLKNRILVSVLRGLLDKSSTSSWENGILIRVELFSELNSWIQETYSIFCNKMNKSMDEEIDYYDIVAPFRRLLNDVCDLVSDYDFDFILLLKDIERDVESLNQKTRHIMVDEYGMESESNDDNDTVCIQDESTVESKVECEEFEESSSDISTMYEDDFENPESVHSEDSREIMKDIVDMICKEINEDIEKLDTIESPLGIVEQNAKKYLCCMNDTRCFCELKFRLMHNIEIVKNHKKRLNTLREDAAILKVELKDLNQRARQFNEKTDKLLAEYTIPTSNSIQENGIWNNNWISIFQ